MSMRRQRGNRALWPQHLAAQGFEPWLLAGANRIPRLALRLLSGFADFRFLSSTMARDDKKILYQNI
ncbi:hypothetical protein CL632_01925 [bacterium]|nr:hypothetical protein [bacterium]